MRDRATYQPARGLRFAATVALVLLIGLAGCRRKRGADQVRLTTEQCSLNVESFDTVWTTIRDQHWDPTLGGTDWDGARRELRPQMEHDRTMRAARNTLAELISRLGTSHFALIPTRPRTTTSDEQRYSGSDELLAKVAPAIRSAEQRYDRGDSGIVVRVLDGTPLITEVYPESPAEVLGVRPGWVVASINGRGVADLIGRDEQKGGPAEQDLALTRAVQSRMLGPTNSKVRLVLQNERDAPVEVEVPFGVPRGHRTQYGLLPPVYVWSEARVLDNGAAYFRLSSFLDPPQVMPALQQLVLTNLDAPGFILDLRGNQGGISAMARGIAGWFIAEDDQYLGTVQMRDLKLRFAVSPRPETYDGPLAILVDNMSASTSEILAAGLRDLGRARVFGTATAAAALPSLVKRLPNGDRFQHAVANYVSHGGEELEGVGLVPDEQVPVTRSALLEGRDPVLEAAQAWIRSQHVQVAEQKLEGNDANRSAREF
ncbi:MAG TPA: S41 family peptidase [Phycisphaerae bacterium]|nr:hypothetical protein [Phycisphaerales bacterium]HRX86248.1 S41 family peptidase [Phycisphaerae bacterium]